MHPHHVVQIKDCLALGDEDLIFNVDNGLTYCKDYHLKTGLHKKLINGGN